jgi:hypothetical protein
MITRDETKLTRNQCFTCNYFDLIKSQKYGYCRRRAPSGKGNIDGHYEWPTVFGADWCGEWLMASNVSIDDFLYLQDVIVETLRKYGREMSWAELTEYEARLKNNTGKKLDIARVDAAKSGKIIIRSLSTGGRPRQMLSLPEWKEDTHEPS